ncbi:MAG: PEGA domain-containing protein [Persicimonas sp.]
MDRLKRGMVTLAILLLGAAMVPAAASTGFAQDEPKSIADEEDKEVARKVLGLIRKGNAAYEEENYEQAYSTYEEAYDVYPDPAFLVRLGRTAEKLDQPKVAIGHYEEFIRLMPDDETSEKLSARIDEIRTPDRVKVTIKSNPEGANVYLGEESAEPVGTTPVDVELEPGTQTVSLEREGYEPQTRSVEIASPMSRPITFDLQAQSVADNNDGYTAADEGAFAADVVGWSTLGAGVASLATSGVFLILKSSAEDDVNSYDKRAPGASPEELADLKSDANSHYDTAIVTGIAGGVLVATGAGFLGYHYMGAEPEEEASLKINAGFDAEAAWLGVNGRF